MGAARSMISTLGRFIDWVDRRIDKPAKGHGTFLQGSEMMIDDETPGETGRSIANKHSGVGRGI